MNSRYREAWFVDKRRSQWRIIEVKVHSIPPKILLILLSLSLLIPIAILERFLLGEHRANLNQFYVVCAVVAFLMVRILRFGKETPLLILGFSMVWAGVAIVQAFLFGLFWVAIFAVGIGSLGTLLSMWLRSELQSPCLESGMHWFMGLPEALPGIRARIEGQEMDFSVAALDPEGTFLFHPRLKPFRKGRSIPITFFDRRGQEFTCRAKPVISVRDGFGVGYRFHSMDLVNSKRSGDMIETLKGVGYEA